MRIGDVARAAGVTPDAVRFYERAGYLPRPGRQANAYRGYTDADLDHIRLLADLRRLDLSLEDSARIATWCHTGRCTDTTRLLPAAIAAKREEIADRIARLRALDGRLRELERHLGALPMADRGGACCASVRSVEEVSGGCACCAIDV